MVKYFAEPPEQSNRSVLPDLLKKIFLMPGCCVILKSVRIFRVPLFQSTEVPYGHSLEKTTSLEIRVVI